MTADLTAMIERIRFSFSTTRVAGGTIICQFRRKLTSSEMVAAAAEDNMRGSEQQTDSVQWPSILWIFTEGVNQIASSNAEMLNSTKVRITSCYKWFQYRY